MSPTDTPPTPSVPDAAQALLDAIDPRHNNGTCLTCGGTEQFTWEAHRSTCRYWASKGTHHPTSPVSGRSLRRLPHPTTNRRPRR